MKLSSSWSMLSRAAYFIGVVLGSSLFLSFVFSKPINSVQGPHDLMVRRFFVWLHGLGDSGSANEHIKDFFKSPELRNATWSFPSAPSMPVSCNYGAMTSSWFDIYEIPITPVSPTDDKGLLEAVQAVHDIIDGEVAAGTDLRNIFICGFSQGGALALTSVLLYPKTLGGCAIFSGWVPFGPSVFDLITPAATKTPILWSHGMNDDTVLFEAGQAGPPLLRLIGAVYEFKAFVKLGHTISTGELKSFEKWVKIRLSSSELP